jgi:serine protease AprX
MKYRILLLLIVVLSFNTVTAQDSRFIIELKDKNRTPFSLSNPSAYLSAKAIARRTIQKLTIDSTDLPVNPAYLDSLRAIPNLIILNKSNWLNQVAVRITNQAALARINNLSFVKAVRLLGARSVSNYQEEILNQEVTGTSLRNEASTRTLANVYNYGTSNGQIHIHNGEYLHNLQFNGSGIVVAMLDAGFLGYKTNVAFDSLRLQNRVLGEWDFVNNEVSVNEDDAHGMYCLSIMTGNRSGLLVGSSPKTSFYLFRTEDNGSEFPIEEQNWVAAAERADSLGVNMITSSLGYSTFDNPSFNHSYAQRDGNTSIVTRGADLAARKGIIVMNSAGNSGNESGEGRYVSCPADGDSVMTVGSVNVSGLISAFSSWGPNGANKLKPNLVSVGTATAVAGIDGNPINGNGTSFSNPNLAGLIACLLQAFPESGNMQLLDAVQRSADRANAPDNRYGYGIPDFKKAFAIMTARSFSGTIARENCSAVFSWSGKDNNLFKYEVQRRTSTDTGFVTIATLNGQGQAFQKNDYRYTASLASAANETIRYRIRELLPGDTAIVLLDSAITVSSECNALPGMTVGPNPFINSINLSVRQSAAPSQYEISVYNALGQQVYAKEVQNPGTDFTLQIPAGSLPKGVYTITVRNGRKVIGSQRAIK